MTMDTMKDVNLRETLPELPEQLYWLDGPYLERSFEYWWHGPLGTYKGTPRDHEHKMVGHQETLRVTGRVHGLHPELGGAMGSAVDYAWTDIDLTRALPDVFYGEER